MKLKLRTGILAVLGIILIFSVPLMANAEEEPVEFQNRDIELQVKQQVGKATGDVYPSDLEELTKLELLNKKIENLTWLRHCDNLEILRIAGCNIKDISPLSNLTNLRNLLLFSCNISDLAPLASLYKLKKVNLRCNSITDIQPLVENTGPEGEDKPNGIGKGDYVKLIYNRLDFSEGSEDLQDIQTLLDRGVEIDYYPQKEEESS